MPEINQATMVITYCSRDKDPSRGLLPALDRYLSKRIRTTYEAASNLETGFRILSGLYGLLAADHEIPFYDHLLTAEQVSGHAGLLEQQLLESGAARVIFVTRTFAVDPGTGPYRESLRQASEAAGTSFHILEIGARDCSPAELAVLIRPLLGHQDG